ncbi:MAG: BrnT family toxin, partial [Verrucomicrobia bacterium]
KKKHEIDFEEAQQLWLDGRQIELPSRNPKEERYLVIGRVNEKIWTAIVTYRNGDIRIISVRRARKNEVEIYES